MPLKFVASRIPLALTNEELVWQHASLAEEVAWATGLALQGSFDPDRSLA